MSEEVMSKFVKLTMIDLKPRETGEGSLANVAKHNSLMSEFQNSVDIEREVLSLVSPTTINDGKVGGDKNGVSERI